MLAIICAVLVGYTLSAGAQTTPGVSETPRTDTLQVLDGEVFDSVIIGNRVIVVGDFTQIRNVGGATITQPYIAAYNADSGRFDGTFRPDVDNFINAIATDGSAVYIVGQFGRVDGEAHRRVAKVDSNGDVVSAFDTSVGTTPDAVAFGQGRVFIGGNFTSVNGQGVEALAALNPDTGNLDASTDFNFEFSVQTGGGIGVRWLEVSPNGSQLWATHTARFIDGQNRTGVARFNISGAGTTLANWSTNLYDNELARFGGALRMRRLAISPDGSYVVVVTSGGDRPPAGDTANRFPTSGGANVNADWVSRHFDTVLGVTISNDAVYVGGHFQFQEAPGSDNPFPGDAQTNFGFGQAQGPIALGNQVVQREQLGALDPTTGKSLDWNPGSDSFIGVQSLTWSNQYGLLVGHDGSRLGGQTNIGRHAIFPIGGGGGGTPTPTGDFSCNATFNNGTATVTFTGDLGFSLQVLRNGGWAGTVNANTVTINANSTDTIAARLRGPNYTEPFQDIACNTGDGGGTPTPTGDFSCNATFNNGTATVTFTGDLGFSLQVLRNGGWAGTVNANTVTINANSTDTIAARLRGPNYTEPFQDIACNTGGNGTALNSTISTPGNGAVVNAGNVTLSGNATSPNGISTVRLTVVRRATGEYLNEDGSYTAEWAPIDIDLNTNASSSPWSVQVRLDFTGQFDISARVFDSDGNRDETQALRSFLVGGATNAPPEISIATPDFDIASSTVVVSGTAADDLGVQSVSFLVRNRATNLYYRADGSIGEAQSLSATLSSPGGTSTEWTRTITGLPVGEWQLTIDGFDTSGQRTRINRVFTQSGNTAPPAITLTSGANQKLPGNSRFSFAGTAEASAGIDHVSVILRDTIDRSGVQANGALGDRAVPFVIPGTNGGTSRNWSYLSPRLPAGTYDVIFRVTDSIGSSNIVRTQIVVGPAGDDLPTITFDIDNRFAQGVDSLRIDISGTAADDNGVNRVTIGILDTDSNEWLQRDGSRGPTPDPFFADLSAPQARQPNWNFTFNAPVAGEYFFFVSAVDTAGQAASDDLLGTFRAFPGDNLPQAVITSPVDGVTITNGRISASGSATDDGTLTAVEILIRNLDTGQSLRSDGSLGAAQWIETSITNPGGNRTNWAYSTPVLPDGEYQVQVRARDNNEQTTSPTTRVNVTLR